MSVVQVNRISYSSNSQLKGADKSANAGNQRLRKHLISQSADGTRYPLGSHVLQGRAVNYFNHVCVCVCELST